MTIDQMQKEIRELGYQWMEHIFNDSIAKSHGDCSIIFTLSQNPNYFNTICRIGDCGWGRFNRQWAWEQAYQHLVFDGTIYHPRSNPDDYHS